MTDVTPDPAIPATPADTDHRSSTGDLEPLQARLSDARLEIDELREAIRLAAQREQSLADELRHRVRNMLAVLRSIYRRSIESGASHEEFAEHFGGRLDTIARYQEGGADLRADGVDLVIMVREELLHVQCQEGPHCVIVGPPVRLRQKFAELMGLAIHELATNAVKFGALATGGTINVHWSLVGPRDGQSLRFRWQERGVPLLLIAPRPQGFGQDLIERAIPYELGATTSFDFKPGGVDCTIEFPLPAP